MLYYTAILELCSVLIVFISGKLPSLSVQPHDDGRQRHICGVILLQKL